MKTDYDFIQEVKEHLDRKVSKYDEKSIVDRKSVIVNRIDELNNQLKLPESEREFDRQSIRVILALSQYELKILAVKAEQCAFVTSAIANK